MRILFCQLRNHGDIIRIFPLLDAIKTYHPDWFIGFTCFHEMIETCELSKSINVIIPQPRFFPVTDTQGGTRILDCSIMEESVTKAKNENFDIYVDLHGVFQSAVFGAMCNIKTRLGRSSETAKDGATLFYTDICQIEKREINRMERHFIVINKLFPEIRPVRKEISNSNKIVIFPGSSKMGILKRWNTERYIEVGKMLSENDIVTFVLGPEEQEISEYLQSNSECKVKICNSWREIETELQNCKLAIGNDGAYMHMAIWKGIPSVMICAPLSPDINGIWKYGIGETVGTPISCNCSNVWKGICKKSHECMEQITVETVLKAVDDVCRECYGEL